MDYRHKTSFQPKIDWDAFYRFVGGSIVAKFTREQLVNKMRKLKSKFLADFKKISQGKDPHFTRASDSELFGYASLIWGAMDKAQQSESSVSERLVNIQFFFCDTHNEWVKLMIRVLFWFHQDEEEEEERVANVEPLNEAGAGKSEFDGKPHHEVVVDDKIVENGTAAGEESHDDDGTTDADELCAVQDAFETLLSQGLSDFKKKFLLEKLMKLGTGKRKELSNDWKELCVEEIKLNIKKLRFSAKLAEAANEKMK